MTTETLPIPPKYGHVEKYPLLRTMAVGESFLVRVPEWGSKGRFQAALLNAAYRVGQGKRFTTRQVENGVRIWRTA